MNRETENYKTFQLINISNQDRQTINTYNFFKKKFLNSDVNFEHMIIKSYKSMF